MTRGSFEFNHNLLITILPREIVLKMLIIRFVLWNESLRTAAKSRTLPAVDTDWLQFQSDEDVGKLDCSNEWNTSIKLLQPYAWSNKNWTDLLSLLDFRCITDRKYHHRNYCLQDEIHAKPKQLFHRKHGHVRSDITDFPFSVLCNED